MGQIVKRKKKGRPSKADLAKRGGDSRSTAPESEPRRSLRRRSVRYNLIYDDDFIDEDYEEFDEDEEDERRREKKLKLVLKLNNGTAPEPQPPPSRVAGAARGAQTPEQSESEDEEEEERKIVKKRKIDPSDCDDDDDEENENENGNDENQNYDEEETGRKRDSKGHDSAPGTPSEHPSGIPLPDKKTLEFILHKLQKKDTYGVYAEPVDPEELPDYHDVIQHPMDFATVRKKLGNGSYTTLEQFENDVFLICSNAMQYNAPDTIYHKQACAIQELAKKKFQKLRNDFERSEKEAKSSEKEVKTEQKPKSLFPAKKQAKKPLSRTMQEPVGSDFSSGATLATAGEVQNGIAPQASGCERPGNTDGLADGNYSMVDNTPERIEELSSGRGLLSKFGRKSSLLDENRRATYNISCQPVVKSDSIFTTFEGEIKQLVAVGLQAEYAYARSLARFAAALGPVAWKVASKRIEQALPAGCKFGRGWVGEYEPLPTPVLMLESHKRKESTLFTKIQATVEVPKEDISCKTPVPAKERSFNVPGSEGRPPFFRPVAGPTSEGKPYLSRPIGGPTSEGKPSLSHPFSGPNSEGKPSFFASVAATTPVNATYKQQNTQSRTSGEPANRVSKQVELNFPPSANQNNTNIVAEKQQSHKSEIATSRSRETVPRNMNVLRSAPSKPLDNNGITAGGLPNGKAVSSCVSSSMASPSESISNQMARAATYLPHGQEQGLSDPVQLMKMLAEKAQKQQNSSSQSPVATTPIRPAVPSVRRDDSSNAAAAAARAWMSIGAGGFKQATENSNSPRNQISAESLYNPAREIPSQISRVRAEFPISPGMQFQPDKNNFPLQAFVPQPIRPANEPQFQNRPMIFPQLVAADLSRFQMQSPWRVLSPHVQPSPQGQPSPRGQPKLKQETLPPDLNIGFQSPGSPVKQSSGVLVDSQQPDLALQL